MRTPEILETSIYVNDLDVSCDFYVSILGFELFTRHENRHVFLKAGNRMLLLFNAQNTLRDVNLPHHGATGAGHIAFGVPESELNEWEDHLKANGIDIEAKVNFPGGRSIYFRDPSGNSLEITTPKIWGLDENLFFSNIKISE